MIYQTGYTLDYNQAITRAEQECNSQVSIQAHQPLPSYSGFLPLIPTNIHFADSMTGGAITHK